MAVRIAEAVHDETGKYKGGKKGDQTGDEVRVRDWYNPKADVVIRFNDLNMREKTAYCMERAALNNKIGYNQNQRNTVYTEAKKVGWDMGAITVPCNSDCSSTTTVACIYAGCPESIMFEGGNCATTSTLKSRIQRSANVTIYTNSAYTRSSKNLIRGDIVIREGHHVYVVLSNGSNASITPASSVPTITKVTKGNSVIKKGQKDANNFVNHDRIAEDGIRGENTKRMATRVLQHAMNLDYNAGLKEDGEWGSKSDRALGSHYVSKGEKQYMVTAAKILYELKGKNPNGVEYPGKFGNGLQSASGKTKITAADFKSLLN